MQKNLLALLAALAAPALVIAADPAELKLAPPNISAPPAELKIQANSSRYAGDRILTFGGGPIPSHSQASLETNVLYLQRVLKDLGLNQIKHDIYFTDGTNTGRTVEVRNPMKAGDGSRELDFRETIAGLWGENTDNVEAQFRPSKIENLAGASTPQAIGNWFDTTGKTMQPKERLLVYFTGHGSPLAGNGRRGPGGANSQPQGPGTQLSTWNNSRITTRELITMLDKLNPDVDVTLVMVQCFSGGFANVIYKDGDPAKGMSPAHRCGFFSTISTRMAAGCTMDIEGDDYQEFSTAFFAALCGKTKMGKTIDKPDYDKNGVTTFDEAFTYVLLTSNTIDIPMTTSDQYLRDKSRFATAGPLNPARPAAGAAGAAGPADAKLLPRDAAYAAVLAAATPSQKAAIEGLSDILKLTGDSRIANARTLSIEIEKERQTIQKTMRDAELEISRLGPQLRNAVESKWPELGVRLHPDAETILNRDAKAIQTAIESSPAYANWLAARQRWKSAEEKDSALERKWVKAQRFLMRCETVILAANLEKSGTPEALAAYKEIAARESSAMNSKK